MLGKNISFHDFLSSAEYFSKSTFKKNSFRNTIRVSISLGPNQALRFFWPDLDPNCLQRSLADTRRERVNYIICFQPPNTQYNSLIEKLGEDNLLVIV